MNQLFNVTYWCSTENKVAGLNCWKKHHKIDRKAQFNYQCVGLH
jgi:hypothetical protein